MEYLTVELDCTDDRCGKCRFIDFGTCLISRKIMQSVYSNGVWGKDYYRNAECIEACKKHKNNIG